MALEAFRKAQISNVEDTVGTAEAATEVLLTHGLTWHEDLLIHYPRNDRGSLALHEGDDEVVQKMVTLTIPSTLTARQAAIYAGMCIRGNVTATQPDAVNQPLSYLWSHEQGYTTGNTPDITNGVNTHTVEYGDDTQAYETEGCFGVNWVISGRPGEPIESVLTLVGRQRVDTTFTAALTKPTVQLLPFGKTAFSIDTSWANLGNTAKTELLRAFTFTFDTGLRFVATANGELYPTKVAEARKAPTFSFTYFWGSDADAERTKYEARTTTFVRLKMLGSTELDSGESNPPYVELDAAIRYTDWPEWGEDEGLSTFEVPATAVYDATGAHMWTLNCYNLMSAFP